jgi:hypothetical protein
MFCIEEFFHNGRSFYYLKLSVSRVKSKHFVNLFNFQYFLFYFASLFLTIQCDYLMSFLMNSRFNSTRGLKKCEGYKR